MMLDCAAPWANCFRTGLALMSDNLALHGLSEKPPEKKHLRNGLSAYFSG